MPNIHAPTSSVCDARSGTRTLKLKPTVETIVTTTSTVSAIGDRAAQATPSRIPATTRVSRLLTTGVSSSTRISLSAISTARKLTAFTTKQNPTPATAIVIPASAGPITREALKRPELSATAFGSSSRADHLEGQRLASGRVEDEDHPAERSEPVDDRQGRDAGEGHHGEHDRYRHRRRLRGDQQPSRVEAVDDHAGDEAEQEEREEPAERKGADRERRARELDHEPCERDVLHPRPRDRDQLTREPQAVVPVAADRAERPAAECDRRARSFRDLQE